MLFVILLAVSLLSALGFEMTKYNNEVRRLGVFSDGFGHKFRRDESDNAVIAVKNKY